MDACFCNNGRGREQGVLVRGGTRPTPSVLGVADVASTSRRAVALPVLSLLPARGNVCIFFHFLRIEL
jgi:hypothetical protein